METRLVRFASGAQNVLCDRQVAHVVFGPFTRPTRVVALRAFGELGLYRLVSIMVDGAEVIGEIVSSCTRSVDGSLVEPATAQPCISLGLPLAAFDAPRDVTLPTCSAGTTLAIGLQNVGMWAGAVELYVVAYEGIGIPDTRRTIG